MRNLAGVHVVVHIIRDLLLCIILFGVIVVGVAAVKAYADRPRPAATLEVAPHVRVPGECAPGQVFDYTGARC